MNELTALFLGFGPPSLVLWIILLVSSSVFSFRVSGWAKRNAIYAAISVATTWLVYILLALLFVISSHTAAGYRTCSIDFCSDVSFFEALGGQLGNLWLLSFFTLGIPPLIVAFTVHLLLIAKIPFHGVVASTNNIIEVWTRLTRG